MPNRERSLRVGGHNYGMTPTLLLTVNIVLGVLTIAAVAALVRLAHVLPTSAPHSDESWGTEGDPWVPSEPLPLRQISEHADERDAARAA